MKTFLILILIVILNLIPPIKAQSFKAELTGNLKADSEFLFNQNKMETLPEINLQTNSRKSPVLAGLFSLVIPGAGEVYAGEYWKAAIFVALEAAVITTAVIYDKKGDNQTESFQKYANENWSVLKYAQWLINNHNADPAIIKNNNPSLQPWEQVDWSLLNANETGSHKLAFYGEQQYYEMIGKYHQFASGWNDFPESQSSTDPISPNFHYYSGERGKANDLYNVASKAVIGIYINHFLSALDAVWSSIQYNKNLALKMRVEKFEFADTIELIPTLNISYNF